MDIALVFEKGTMNSDILLDLEECDDNRLLETAVLMSLFTDRRADEDDAPEESNRRGWWGDQYQNVPDDKIGSKLWLLKRQKQTAEVETFANIYANEAIQWLVTDGVASSATAVAAFISRGVMKITVEIQKPDGSLPIIYQYVWNQF